VSNTANSNEGAVDDLTNLPQVHYSSPSIPTLTLFQAKSVHREMARPPSPRPRPKDKILGILGMGWIGKVPPLRIPQQTAILILTYRRK
jgi:hypothetical protein